MGRRSVAIALIGAAAVLLPAAAVSVARQLRNIARSDAAAVIEGTDPNATVSMRRARLSLHHGVWFEFDVINHDHISQIYWRARPWRRTEISQ